MDLLKLAASPLECVRLTTRRHVRVWLARHHIECPDNSISLVFSPEEIPPGEDILIDGRRNVFYCKGKYCYQARIYDVGINIDRYGIGADEEFRSAAGRILPFQHGIGHGIFSVSKVYQGDSIQSARTVLISDDVRDEMLSRADLLMTQSKPREWQNMCISDPSKKVQYTHA